MINYMKEIASSTIYVFDTNILLNLYYTKQNNIVYLEEYLDKIKNYIWIPDQVYYEYLEKKDSKNYTNRVKKINEIIQELRDICKYAPKMGSTINSQLKKYDRNSIGTSTILQKEFNKYVLAINQKIEYLNQDILRDINRLGSYKYINNDELYVIFKEKIFNNKGEKYDTEKLKQIIIEAKKRYGEKDAPGYIDVKKDDNKYGDYIMWKQILDCAKDKLVNIVLVSGDFKEDWIDKSTGKCKTNYVQEFYEITKMNFELINLDELINRTTKYKNLNELFEGLLYMHHHDIVDNSPYKYRYNIYDLYHLICIQRKEEFNILTDDNGNDFKELIKTRGFVEMYFPQLICGGIHNFRYALSLNIYTNSQSPNYLLCKVLYTSRNDSIQISIACEDEYIVPNKKVFELDENGNLDRKGYVDFIVFCIYKVATKKGYYLCDDEILHFNINKINNEQYFID